MTAQRSAGRGAVAFLVGVFAATDASAQQFMPTGRETLKGLPGVEAIVEPLDADLERDGLRTADIQANVVRVLRSAGIPLYANQNENPSPAKAYVYVQVTGLSLPRQGHLLVVQVHLRQTLRSLVTGSAIVNAMTWDHQHVLFAPSGSSMQGVNGEIEDLIDRFVQDWRRVH